MALLQGSDLDLMVFSFLEGQTLLKMAQVPPKSYFQVLNSLYSDPLVKHSGKQSQ